VDRVAARLYLRDHEWQANLNTVTNNWYPIAVPINQPARWEALDNAVRELDENGTLDQIIDRWL
jgi:ABC-type amino acid transport substrate-binding protein